MEIIGPVDPVFARAVEDRAPHRLRFRVRGEGLEDSGTPVGSDDTMVLGGGDDLSPRSFGRPGSELEDRRAGDLDPGDAVLIHERSLR